MKRILMCLLCLFLMAPACSLAETQGLPLQECHRFTLTDKTIRQRNGSVAVLWQIDTACDAVDGDVNAIASGWMEEIAPTLPAPGSDNSRVNVIIRPSRTGLSWMSFMVQARTIYHQKTVDVRFTTRTYNMKTGERVLLTDVFPEDSEAWDLMAQAIRDGVKAYYPALPADEALLDNVCSREAMEQMDFTFHGMSLVLHLDAELFYPGHPQLLEISLYYPDIRPFMTEEARVETDNQAYYKMVALTFDDGPNGWCTDQNLLALMKTGERATFFLVGERVAQQGYLVQREHDEGHAIASHNWQHVYANDTPLEKLRTMPPKVEDVHIATVGIPVRYARAPGGQWERMAEAGMGWPLIQWTVETQDWDGGPQGPEPKMMAGNIVAGTDDGGIILMHDSKPNTPIAVELFIRQLQEDGYMFLTVDELFVKDGVVLEPDTAYWRCTDGVTTK